MQDGAGAEGGGGMQLLLTILADGEEQARQLGELVADDDDPRSRTAEHYRGAARRLQCTLGKAVAVAKAVEAASTGSSRGTDDSPRSADESSGATAVASALETQERQGVPLCKRRKGLPRWTARFRVPDANLEATPDDGLSWRKYGQKDILGARFPRGYYRCTYRAAQGCPATKQVQRSDADLCVFDVTYQGDHTCHQKPRHAAACSQSQPPPLQQQDPAGMQLVAAAMGFKDALNLKVETEEAAAALHCHGDASFCFPPVPFHHAGGEALAPAAAFSPSGGSSYDFSAAATHHGPVGARSCYDVYDYDQQQGPGGARVHGAESELAEVVSRAIAAPGAGAGFEFEFDRSSLYHQAGPGLDPHPPFPPPFGGPSAPYGPYQ